MFGMIYDAGQSPSMEEFLFRLPKVELHAHLNGSLSVESMQELYTELNGISADQQEFKAVCEKYIDYKDVSLRDWFGKFKVMHEMTATPTGLRKATLMVIRDFAKDNVIYLELRTTPKNTHYMSLSQYLKCVVKAIIMAKKLYPSISVKLLPTINREQHIATANETLLEAIALRARYPGIIGGLDFSGSPYSGSLDEFTQLIVEAKRCSFKLTMHVSEIANSETDKVLIDLGMDRCGHGTNLIGEHFEKLAQQHSAIECCLTSQVKCQTVRSYQEHPFGRWYKDGHPVVLCTDDCGLFDTTLTKELLIAAHEFGLQREDFRRLQKMAVEHSFTDVYEKRALDEKIEAYFMGNCEREMGSLTIS